MSDHERTASASTDGRRTRWAAHRAARRRQLIEAGLTVLNQVGPAFGLELVAERAGVTKPVVYRHFADRAGLIDAMGQRAVEVMIDERILPALGTDGPLRARVRGVIDAFVGFVEEYPNVYWFAVRYEPGASLGWVRASKNMIAEGLTSVISSAMSAGHRGDPGLATMWAHGLVGFVQNVVEMWLDDRSTTRAVLVDNLTELAWVQMEGFARKNGVVLDPDVALDLDDLTRQATVGPAGSVGSAGSRVSLNPQWDGSKPSAP